MISWYSAFMSMAVTPSTPPTEEPRRRLEPLDELVDLGLRRVEVERRARRRLDAEPRVRRLRAVVARAYGDPPRVEQLRDVVRVHAVELEADRAAPVNRLAWSED